jgi:hypothetical protein
MNNPQDEKCVALLKYVLEKKKKIYPHHYSVLLDDGDSWGDDNLVLRRVHSGKWEISNFERGKEYIYATFYSTSDAISYFYSMFNGIIIPPPSPFSFIKEFEQETGIVW